MADFSCGLAPKLHGTHGTHSHHMFFSVLSVLSVDIQSSDHQKVKSLAVQFWMLLRSCLSLVKYWKKQVDTLQITHALGIWSLKLPSPELELTEIIQSRVLPKITTTACSMNGVSFLHHISKNKAIESCLI